MKQYLDLLENIVDNGVEKESGRANMPNTIGISFGVIQMDMNDGFPLLTTKKMYWKGIVHELLWFLRGDTNIKYLVDNKVNIWNGDAYRWYNDIYVAKRGAPALTIEEFLQYVKDGKTFMYNPHPDVYFMDTYKYGDLGKVYGHQWRNQNGVDQIKKLVEGLKKNPYSRYHITNAWNAADFDEMALPPCHLLYQFISRPIGYMERTDLAWQMGLEKEYKKVAPKKEEEWALWLDEHGVPKFYLDLNMYQRSCDIFLGVPFNIASMSLLLMIIAKTSNMVGGVATWIGGDTHLYVSHLGVVEEQLQRIPLQLPTMEIHKDLNTLDDILTLTIDDFELSDYEYLPELKAELFTGLKKK
jgi:thymidylate synthase